MKHKETTLISLGGGCDVGIILKFYGLRRGRYPFDWLWNLDGGLTNVSNIIASDFKNIRDVEDFCYAPHATWPESEKVVFRCYKNIAHVHSNPLDNPLDLRLFNKRIEDFERLIRDPERNITFIYYRNAPDINKDNDQESLLSLQKLIAESCHFEKLMEQKYPNTKFRLVSLLSLPRSKFKNSALVKELNKISEPLQSKTTSYGIVSQNINNNNGNRRLNKIIFCYHWHKALTKTHTTSHMDLLLKPFRKVAYHWRKNWQLASRI